MLLTSDNCFRQTDSTVDCIAWRMAFLWLLLRVFPIPMPPTELSTKSVKNVIKSDKSIGNLHWRPATNTEKKKTPKYINNSVLVSFSCSYFSLDILSVANDLWRSKVTILSTRSINNVCARRMNKLLLLLLFASTISQWATTARRSSYSAGDNSRRSIPMCVYLSIGFFGLVEYSKWNKNQNSADSEV